MSGTYFERYCRQPGTRINAIMTRLERGEDEAAIAARYQTRPAVIKVYRKALEDKLSKGRQRGPQELMKAAGQLMPSRGEERAKRRQLVIAMWREGKSTREIGAALGMSTKQVAACCTGRSKKGGYGNERGNRQERHRVHEGEGDAHEAGHGERGTEPGA